MKSYGKITSEWNEAKIKEILEYALCITRECGKSQSIGEDENGNAVIMPNVRDSQMHILACGTSANPKSKENGEYQEFWDHVAHEQYTIDEMVPRVYDCLVKKIIKFGSLRFLSEGRWQLSRIMMTAKKMIKIYDRSFIVGIIEGKGITLAPSSEASRFFLPCSCVINKFGCWSVSDTLSTMIAASGFMMVGEHEIDYLERLGNMDGAMVMLYEAMAYSTKHYGPLSSDPKLGTVQLEVAFEDAAKISKRWEKEPMCVGLDDHNRIAIYRKNDRGIPVIMSIDVSANEFWQKDTLLQDMIKSAAIDAYETFSDAIKNCKDD